MRRYGAWLALGLLYFIPLIDISHVIKPARLSTPPDLSVYPWVYLRQEQSLDSEESAKEVILVGDILCGRKGNSQGLDMSEVIPWLKTADLVIGNLECVISSPETGLGLTSQAKDESSYVLYGFPFQASLLRQAGFDVLGVANNHALDLGKGGLEDTVSYLRQNGIDVAGLRDAGNCGIQPVIRHLGGLRIAVLAFNAIPPIGGGQVSITNNGLSIVSWQDRACLLSEIQTLRQQSDVVIVSVHWGYEYEIQFDPAQQEIARQLIAAGADLVVGHHPHVTQKIEIFPRQDDQPEGVVVYSLGNFLADQQFGETVVGLGIRAMIDKQGLRAVQAISLQAGPQPHLMEIGQASPYLERIMPAPRRVSFSCNANTCFEKQSIDDKESSLFSSFFWSGEIDLTGDGIPEQIQRQSEQVVVYQNGNEVWRTPQTWQVVDLALGDPDGDGRQEIMVAFWRKDQSGILRSHPFILGYRGGTYHETWGGSGVSDPILELDLGDVDGDGVQELVVLEQRKSGKQAVTVWDWHGWGFNLKWRSPEGNYSGLSIESGDGEENDLIRVNMTLTR